MRQLRHACCLARSSIDSVLSAAEQMAGDRLMACVSRAAGPRLVLDL